MESPFIGIEIGGTKLQVVSGDAAGAIAERRRATVDRQAGHAGILRQLEAALRDLGAHAKPRAAGVGFGGPLDWRRGTIARSHHVEGWSGFDLAAWVQSVLGAPCRVENDANVAALAEAKIGAGAGLDPVFYVTLGSGVGGGLVTGGRIYHGAPPGEAEIGHLRLDRTGTILEDRCSGWAVDRRIRAVLDSGEPTMLRTLAGATRGGEARWLGEPLSRGDAVAGRILHETALDLAFGLSHVVHLFHPAVIVLGGGLSLLGEPLRHAVASALPGMLMESFRPGPDIRLAALREDAVPAGALLLAADSPGA